MTPQKLVVLTTSLTGGAIGLLGLEVFFHHGPDALFLVQVAAAFDPFIGISADQLGILTLFFFPVWCLLFAFGLLLGRRLGVLLTGKRALPR